MVDSSNRTAIPTGTVTFLFTDIEGSTVLWEDHPEQMQDALARHYEILHAAIEARGGYVFKMIGDACCAAFASAKEAILATLEAQRALFAEPWDEHTTIRVRMALHTGIAEERRGDYFGPPVNRVARLLSAGHGGQILLSDATYNLVRDALRHIEPGSELRDLGEHRLRDLKYTERISQLIVPDLPADFPPPRTHGLVTRDPSGTRAPKKPEPETERYHIRQLLGRGMAGEVYLAHDEVLDRDVAYKVLKEQYASDEKFVQRFRREAQNAARLSHANIVTVYDQGRTKTGTYYMVMEYMTGGTLKDLMRQGPLPPVRVATLTLQVARALQAAHRRGVIHRDIKPQNILLTETGEAKVADFGIALATSLIAVTPEGSVLGTAHYISPEQANGRSATSQSDFYSLGVVLYEMLTGRVPFDADTVIGILTMHMSGQLRPPKKVNPDVPDSLNAITVRLLAKDPGERYSDAAELIDDLERAKEGRERRGSRETEWGASNGGVTTVEPPETSNEETKPTEEDLDQAVSDPSTGASDGRGGSGGGVPIVETPERSGSQDQLQQDREEGRDVVPPLPPTPLPKRNWRLVAFGLVAVVALIGVAIWFLIPGEQAPPGQGEEEVPSLVGQTMEQARQTAGDDFDVVAEEGGVLSDEVVLSHEPPAGERADRGSEISVVLGDCGVQRCVTVPDVTGDTVTVAREALKDAGLNLTNVHEKSSDTVPRGQIISQSPPPGSQALPEALVDVTVSRGS